VTKIANKLIKQLTTLSRGELEALLAEEEGKGNCLPTGNVWNGVITLWHILAGDVTAFCVAYMALIERVEAVIAVCSYPHLIPAFSLT
jgi:hypothetical protein